MRKTTSMSLAPIVTVALYVAIFSACASSGGERRSGGGQPKSGRSSTVSERTDTLLAARRNFETELTNLVEFDEGPAPDPPGEHYRKVWYPSPAGDLVAYLGREPAGRGPHPVLVWAHGGFGGIGKYVWQNRSAVLEPFIEAGFVVLVPSWRGENDNPGTYEMFYGEVRDLVSAIEYVRDKPYVDPNRIYLAGHSSGGTLALLAAESTPDLRAVFAFGGAADMESLFAGSEDPYGNTPFDPSRTGELRYRSFDEWIERLQVPTYYIEGESSSYPVWAELVELETERRDLPFRSYVVDGGNHFDVLKILRPEFVERLVDDTGEQVDLALDQAAVQRAFDEATGHTSSYQPKDGNFFARDCRVRREKRSCTELANAYERGFVGERRRARAFVWYAYGCSLEGDEACPSAARISSGAGNRPTSDLIEELRRACKDETSDPMICATIASMYRRFDRAEDNISRARNLAEYGCRRGSGVACAIKATTYVPESPTERHDRVDHQKAAAAYRRACEAERPEYEGCRHLGRLWEMGMLGERDYDRARKFYRKACDGGSAVGCHSIGVMLATGRGVEEDDERAVHYYRRACNLGDPHACTDLGDRFIDGNGVPRDAETGARLIVRACEDSGEDYSCRMAGRVYRRGLGVAEDETKAASYYEDACDRGSGTACLQLGKLLEDDAIGPDDVDGDATTYFERAREYLRNNCRVHADGRDCARLAELVRDGKGGDTDPARAEELFEKACELDDRACDW